MFGELWVNIMTLDIKFPKEFDPLSPNHYLDSHAEAHGIMAELYQDLKIRPNLQNVLVDHDQRPMFAKYVGYNLASATCH